MNHNLADFTNISSSGATGTDASRTPLDWPRHAGTVDLVLSNIKERIRQRRRRRSAVLAGALTAVIVFGMVWINRPVSVTETDLRLAGNSSMRPTMEVLSDGSVVHLREGTSIRVAFDQDQRRVILEKGEAYFQVTKNPRRPFLVVAGGVDVQAVGTAFGVKFDGRAIEVLVTEGQVAVARETATDPMDGQSTTTAPSILFPGNQLTVVTEAGPQQQAVMTTVSAAEIDVRLAWRVPRLDLVNTPLAEAIALFNEHGHAKIILADPALGELRVSGVLRVDHPELLLRLLEQNFGIRVEHRSGNEFICFRSH